MLYYLENNIDSYSEQSLIFRFFKFHSPKSYKYISNNESSIKESKVIEELQICPHWFFIEGKTRSILKHASIHSNREIS